MPSALLRTIPSLQSGSGIWVWGVVSFHPSGLERFDGDAGFLHAAPALRTPALQGVITRTKHLIPVNVIKPSLDRLGLG